MKQISLKTILCMVVLVLVLSSSSQVRAGTFITDTTPGHMPALYNSGWLFTVDADPTASENVCIDITNNPYTLFTSVECIHTRRNHYTCDPFPGGPIPAAYRSTQISYYTYIAKDGICPTAVMPDFADPTIISGTFYEFTTNPTAVEGILRFSAAQSQAWPVFAVLGLAVAASGSALLGANRRSKHLHPTDSK